MTTADGKPLATPLSPARNAALVHDYEAEKSLVYIHDLNFDADGAWRVIGPTEPGPQKWGTGGEMAMWLSPDKGATWRKNADLTANSARNHSYARRPLDAHPDFYAFWADGNTGQRSESRLYFASRDGNVFQLPDAMKEDFAQPTLITPDPRK